MVVMGLNPILIIGHLGETYNLVCCLLSYPPSLLSSPPNKKDAAYDLHT